MLELLTRTPDLRTLPDQEVAILSAMRLWVVMHKTGNPPMRAVTERLGSARAAAHLHLLIEEIGAAWPEPFCVGPPCCPLLSHDEGTLVEMIRAGGRGDRPGFDRLLSDLLPADTRERLYLSVSVLSRSCRNG